MCMKRPDGFRAAVIGGPRRGLSARCGWFRTTGGSGCRGVTKGILLSQRVAGLFTILAQICQRRYDTTFVPVLAAEHAWSHAARLGVLMLRQEERPFVQCIQTTVGVLMQCGQRSARCEARGGFARFAVHMSTLFDINNVLQQYCASADCQLGLGLEQQKHMSRRDHLQRESGAWYNPSRIYSFNLERTARSFARVAEGEKRCGYTCGSQPDFPGTSLIYH